MARREKQPVHKIVMTEGKRIIVQNLPERANVDNFLERRYKRFCQYVNCVFDFLLV